jgi:hypothetical protein
VVDKFNSPILAPDLPRSVPPHAWTSAKTKAEGKTEKAAGKVQNAVGGLNDAARGK